MNTACAKWKDALLEAALSGTVTGELESHLKRCPHCAGALAALRERQEHMDALLPLVASGAEPSAEFRTRVLAEAQSLGAARRAQRWRAWVLAGATVAILAAAIISGSYLRRQRTAQDTELMAAQRLADWRAPSDVLLNTPGKGFLRATPRLGESYVKLPIAMDKED